MLPWRLALGLLGVAAYALASHLLMLHAAEEPWAVAALLGPLLAMTGLYAAQRKQWPMLLAVLVAAVGLVGLVMLGGAGEVSRLYVLQHAGVHASLGLSFAASLRGPQASLISRLAARLHPLTPAMLAYTRRVTQVWVGYFFSMAAVSVLLYLWGPWSAWSLLANVLTPLAIGLLFVGEYLLRYRLHPEFERTTLAAAWRAYSRSEP